MTNKTWDFTTRKREKRVEMWIIYFETEFGWRETRAKNEIQARAWVQNYENSVGLDAYYERI